MAAVFASSSAEGGPGGAELGTTAVEMAMNKSNADGETKDPDADPATVQKQVVDFGDAEEGVGEEIDGTEEAVRENQECRQCLEPAFRRKYVCCASCTSCAPTGVQLECVSLRLCTQVL